MNLIDKKNIIENIFYLISLILSIILIFYGFKFLNEASFSLSLYRSILFGYMPIFIGIILLFLNINYKIIIINTFFLFLITTIIFEIFLILSEKKINLSSNNQYQIYPPHLGCGGINSLSPSNYKYVNNLSNYPLSGKSHNFVSLKNEVTGKLTKDKTDNYGFKNSFDWNRESSFDNIFIGDSFTYGTDVAHGESFAEIVKEKFTSTLNLGCGGTGPIMQLGIFREYVKILKPKFVIWNFYSGNDLNSDIPSEYNSYYKNYLKDDFIQDLINKQNEVDIIHDNFLSNVKLKLKNKKIENKNKENQLKNFYKLRKLRIKLGLQYAFSPNSLEILEDILFKVNNETKEWNGEFIFVFIPSPNKYINPFHRNDHDYYYNNLFKLLKKNNIKVINLDNELKKFKNPGKFYSGHLNSDGNELLAKLILEKIMNLKN